MDDQLDEKRARYEDMLLAILQSEEKIEPFIDTIFNFLHRRTDFFLVQETATQPFGFPKGAAKQIVTKLFQKYDNLPKDVQKQRLLETNSEISQKLQSSAKISNPEPSPTDSELSSSNVTKTSNKEISKGSASEPNAEGLPLEKQQEVFQSNPSSYNGAIRDKYSWTQSIKDIDVRIKVAPSLKSSKQCKIKIEKETLQVSVVDPETKSWAVLIDDKMPWKVRPEQSTWSLFPGEQIHIYLEKSEERWWENLLMSEAKLNLKYMNPEKPMEDLDEEAQAKIKQMMYDEQQKRLGLPTSEEQRQQEILRKAWDLEGSPFKGMPFDPSILQNK